MTEAVAPRILRLSEQTISQVHSSKHISSLHSVVFALLENSLDAGSNRVEISVDWPRGGCTVEDNGQGIPSIEFGPDGGLAQMYCTSKRQPSGESKNPRLDAHGIHGMFLAELASLSLMSITSRSRHHDGTATITLHHGTVIARQIRIPSSRDESFRESVEQHGTTVTVRDLFGSMPVRVKQRALAEPEEQKSWYELKRGVLALLLAWPSPCSVKLRDVDSASRVVTLASRRPGTTSELTKRNLSHLSGESQTFDLRDGLSLLFQSNLASPESRNDWIPLSASTSALSLKGLICLEPAPTKECQFISIGIHPCNRNSGHSGLYQTVDGMFRDSDFGIIELERVGQNHRGAAGSATRNTGKLRQTGKGADRFAMFHIQITLESNFGHRVDNIDNFSDALLAAMANLLEIAITSWLDKNLFRPRKRRRICDTDSISPSKSEIQPSPSAGYSPVRAQYRLKRSPKNEETTLTSAFASTGKTKSQLPRHRHGDELSLRSHIRTGSAYKRTDGRRLNPPPANAKAAVEDIGLHRSLMPGEATNPSPILPKHGLFDLSAIGAGTPSGTIGTHYKKDRGGSLPEPALPCPEGDHPGILTHRSQPRNFVLTSSTSQDDFGSIDENDMIAVENAENASVDIQGGDEQVLQWTDPVSKQTFRLNARTGVVLPPEIGPPTICDRSHSSNDQHRATLGTPLSSSGNPLRLVERLARDNRNDTVNDDHSKRWLPEFLRNWNNPVFDTQSEGPVRVLSLGQSALARNTSQECFVHAEPGQKYAIETIRKPVTQMSRAALSNTQIIGQVDGKYILCRMNGASKPLALGISCEDDSNENEQLLVLVDQHAASERVLVENLLHDYADSLQPGPRTVQGSSDSPHDRVASDVHIQFDVTPQEYDLFKSYRDHFAAWGILYDASQVHTNTSTLAPPGNQELRIVVRSLPAVVAERCANFPRLCIDFMRIEAWELADGTRKPVPPSFIQRNERCTDGSAGASAEPIWLELVSSCPRGLLDMINSRACRSAVMFNDVLTNSQCQSLMAELSACTFPFICAHGRVSMVPLVQMGSS